MVQTLKTTPLFDQHQTAGARLVDFSGWNMPVQYPDGIIKEHLATRHSAGLFDVSHMGRFLITGPDALPFLRYVLTNDAALLSPGCSQYTIISSEEGTAIDDAYLCQWIESEYLLVVNAGNLQKDWQHLFEQSAHFNVLLENISETSAMLAVQGPCSSTVLTELLQGEMPGAQRNCLSLMGRNETPVRVSRTGYTGEPVGFELILPAEAAPELWEAIIDKGVAPVGLGARDTLRLEASLPLYGHEFGEAPDGTQIPIFACPLAKFAVKLSPERPDFIGRKALEEQFNSPPAKRISPFIVTGKGIPRAGCQVFIAGKHTGWVTSGTMVPYWKTPATDDNETGMRAIGLALIDRSVKAGEQLEFSVRGKTVIGIAVSANLKNRQPPYALPVLVS